MGAFHQPPNRSGASTAQAGGAAGAGQHTGGGDTMAAGGAIEPVPAILALRVRQSLFLFTLGTHAIHFMAGNVIFENQSTFRADFGIAAVIGSLAARGRANENRVT